MNKKPTFACRVNSWLDEPSGEKFKTNKWRFWLPTLLGLGALNGILTAAIFHTFNGYFWVSGAMLGAAGAVSWIGVACLHYSDDERDARLARGVAAFDSVTLIFVVAHFCFLLWVFGHMITLHAAENDYKIQAAQFNDKAQAVSQDNVKIAEAAQRIAQESTKTERLRNDTAYQTRKAAEAGARLPGRSSSVEAIAPSLSTQTITLERPTKPKESSTEFLSEWDKWIRLTNFGEITLAVITMIFIRNQTAKTNIRTAPVRREDEFPAELDAETRSPAPRERLELAQAGNSTKKKDTRKTHESFDFDPTRYATGLKALREVLKDISFEHPGISFKVDLKPDCVWIRAMAANQGTQETVSSMRAKLQILEDVLVMPQAEFRERLENMLRQNGFEI